VRIWHEGSGFLFQALCWKAQGCPTKRAPDGWWAPRFELDSSEEFGSVSLVGSPQPPVTQAVGRCIAKV